MSKLIDILLDTVLPTKVALHDAANILDQYESIWCDLQQGIIPLKRMSYMFTEWYPISDNEYIAMSISFNLNDIQDRYCRVWSGYYCNTNERIIESDRCLDITCTKEAIQAAVDDVIQEKDDFKLFNKNILYQTELPWYAAKENVS